MGRRTRLTAGAVVVAAAAGTAGASLILTDGSRTAGTTKKAAPATAEIVRGDLADTISVDGRLTYTAGRKVAGGATGTLTSVPAQGRVVRQGDALYEVDRRPVVLMYGVVPLYRTLGPGVEDGPDVRQLEAALKTLGYGDDLTVDERFSPATARAVRRWQKDDHLAWTGSVDASQVVFLPAKVRVTETKAAVGDRVSAGRQILAVSGTERVVHVDLDADRQKLAKKGAPVTVELPGGATANGTITSVGTVARKQNQSADSPAASGQGPAATIDVDIELTGVKATGRLDQAPVTVTMESERRKNVLSVPVEALLALREGGYGVEVVEPGGARRTVSVTTGAYGGGRVEISGAGLAAGTKVGVPAQ
jgi:peptidoglycan hydrolase-like protein with peptidoglycan-binding domain